MKTLKLFPPAWLLCFFILNSAFYLHAQNTTFTYQGRVQDNGTNYTGTGQFLFALVTTSAGTTTTLWSNDGTTGAGQFPAATLGLGVTNGLFTVTLGSPAVPGMAALPATVFGQAGVQLEIWFSDGINVTNAFPLQSLTPAPYATVAGSANTLNGPLPLTQLPASVLTNGENGTLAQVVAASTSFTAQANTAYDLTNAAEVGVVLPANANVGDVIQVTGAGAGGWQVTAELSAWTEQPSAPTAVGWSCVASSADGTHLVAAHGGYVQGIYTSTNSGVTWTQQTTPFEGGGWAGVASSADGAHLVAVDDGGGICTSANSGVTWTQQTGPPALGAWSGVASSADGTHLVAVADEGGIYTSANSGVTWTEQTGVSTSTNWHGVASSADGTHLVAVVLSGGIYTSANSGLTWMQQTGPPVSGSWWSIASSADGTRLVAVANGGGIYTSTNSGVTWMERTSAPTAVWEAVASSADGNHLVASAVFGGIYTSADSGATWTEETGPPASGDWSSVASSADGIHLVAVAGGGGIYTSLNGVTGAAGTSEQFQYLGNGLWQPLPPTAGYLANNGSTVLSPGNVSGLTGTIADSLLSANVALRAGGYAFTGNQTITGGSLGIGLTSPTYPLEVAANGAAIMTLDNQGNLECSGTVYSKGIALTSDRNAKENFAPVDNQAVLARVAALPVTKWNYKTDQKGVQHIGPMAQDFQAAFGLDGPDDKHISVVDEGGVALAAIQGLNQKLQEQMREKDAEIAQLQAKASQVDALQKQMNELAAAVKSLTGKN